MDKFAIFCWVCLIITCAAATVEWHELRRSMKMFRAVNSILEQASLELGDFIYTSTSQGVSIYIVEDRVWIDSGYLEEYIETRTLRKVNWQKVNWQKEGF